MMTTTTMLHLPMASWNGGAKSRPGRRADRDSAEDVAAAMGASSSSWPAPASVAAGGGKNGRHGDDAKGAGVPSSSLALAHEVRTGNADTPLVGSGMVDASLAMRAAMAWTMMGLPTMALKYS